MIADSPMTAAEQRAFELYEKWVAEARMHNRIALDPKVTDVQRTAQAHRMMMADKTWREAWAALNWEVALLRAQAARIEWNIHLRALGDYEQTHPDWSPDDPEYARLDAISGEWCERDSQALKALMDVPAPSIATALAKLELAIEQGISADFAMSDLYRLTGLTAAPSLLETA